MGNFLGVRPVKPLDRKLVGIPGKVFTAYHKSWFQNLFSWLFTCMHACCVRVHVCVRVCVYLHMCMYGNYMYMCMCLCE